MEWLSISRKNFLQDCSFSLFSNSFSDTIFVAGGTDGFDIGTAEVLRLTVGGPDYFCRDVPDLTEDAYDMQGMTDDEGRPMACGGFGNVDGTYCQVYDADSRTWEEGPRMVYSRDKSATVLLADGRYWISGGFATWVQQQQQTVYTPLSHLNKKKKKRIFFSYLPDLRAK